MYLLFTNIAHILYKAFHIIYYAYIPAISDFFLNNELEELRRQFADLTMQKLCKCTGW